MDRTIAVIGAGAMGGAFARGVLSAGIVPPARLRVSNPSSGKLGPFAEAGAFTTRDNGVAAEEADIVVIAVKPWLVEPVVTELRPSLGRASALVSFAAGVSVAQLRGFVGPEGPEVMTVIPNIAISLGESMTFLVPERPDSPAAAEVKALFDALGETIVTDGAHIAAGTALASCGIAYAMRYVRAAAEGGVELGFPAAAAERIVLQTVKGAASLLQSTGLHPEEAIDRVTTPGGLTIKGLNEMERCGFSSAVVQGLKASLK